MLYFSLLSSPLLSSLFTHKLHIHIYTPIMLHMHCIHCMPFFRSSSSSSMRTVGTYTCVCMYNSVGIDSLAHSTDRSTDQPHTRTHTQSLMLNNKHLRPLCILLNNTPPLCIVLLYVYTATFPCRLLYLSIYPLLATTPHQHRLKDSSRPSPRVDLTPLPARS